MVMETKKCVVFAVGAMLLFIALALILYVMVTACGPSNISRQANYAGKAKLVLEIVNRTDSEILGKECIPTYNVRVLYSNDSAIKEGSTYYLGITEVLTGYFGASGVMPKELVNGSIIGIDDYGLKSNAGMPTYAQQSYDFDGSTINVWVGADPKDKAAWDNAWKQRIRILSEPAGTTLSNHLSLIGSLSSSRFRS